MDKQRARAFMGTMVGILNGGSLALMCSIGHRTGLFDTMSGAGPVTSEELATMAGLDERYVREWLAAMASGDIVEYDPTTASFTLPDEHVMLLTRAGGPLNIAATLQFIALLAEVEDDVVDAFRTGAGVGYDRYPKFQELMASDSATRFEADLLDTMIVNVPGAVDKLTKGARLGDLGCGSGIALTILAEAFPNSSFVGYDFSDEGLTAARSLAESKNLSNIEFVAVDAAELEVDSEFDFVTSFDAIHDQAFPDQVLRNIHDALVPGGWYLCVEPKAHSCLEQNMHEPAAAYQYTISAMHCMSVSIANGGVGLGTAWGVEKIFEALESAGFSTITTCEVRSDRTNSHFVAQRH